MLIVPYVAAEFFDKTGNRLFKITPEMRAAFTEVGENVWQDPLFRMLVNDGSIKIITDDTNRRALENNPMAGITPEGKSAGLTVSGNKSVTPTDESTGQESRQKAAKPKTEAKPKAESKVSATEAKADDGTETKPEVKPGK